VTARIHKPNLILGHLDGAEVGFRRLRRAVAIRTSLLQTPVGALIVPILQEMVVIKGWLTYQRCARRDFLDFAALVDVLGGPDSIAAPLELDRLYSPLQSTPVGLSVSAALVEVQPFDLSEVKPSEYRGLAPEWQDWSKVQAICQRIGSELGKRLVLSGGGSRAP